MDRAATKTKGSKKTTDQKNKITVMDTINLICFHCVHFRPYAGGCDAFPDGISDDVLEFNQHDHRLPGQDNDIVFEDGTPREQIEVTGIDPQSSH